MRGNKYPSNRDESYWRDKIEELEKRIRDLETGRRAVATSIGTGEFSIQGGVFRISNAGGDQILTIGPYHRIFAPIEGYDPNQTVIQMSRGNGTQFFMLVGSADGNQYWQFLDEDQNSIMSEDWVSGQGLARPYIPLGVQTTAEYFSAPPNTTSATFTPLWTAHADKQHPRVKAVVVVSTPAGTTGEVDLWDAFQNIQIDGPYTIPSAANQYVFMTGEVQGNHMDMIKVEVRARRTAGTGSVTVGMAYMNGVQSP